MPIVKSTTVTGVHCVTINWYPQSLEHSKTTSQRTQSKINQNLRKLSDRYEQYLVRYTLFHRLKTIKLLAKRKLSGGHEIHLTLVSRIVNQHEFLLNSSKETILDEEKAKLNYSLPKTIWTEQWRTRRMWRLMMNAHLKLVTYIKENESYERKARNILTLTRN